MTLPRLASQVRPHGLSVPVVKACACPPEHRPEKTVAHAYLVLRQLVLLFSIPADTPLFDVRCSRCRGVMVVTAGDVRAA